MNPLETAAEALKDEHITNTTIVEDVASVLRAFFRAVWGCPNCNGTGTDPCGFHDDCQPCESEHVELSILGETVWADPAKCVWYCAVIDVAKPAELYADDVNPPDGCRRLHYERDGTNCGWQPRWDEINKEQA